jgi:outer membrane immunogenic protein
MRAISSTAIAASVVLASVAAAAAADLPVKAPPLAQATVFSWTGFYFGGHVGGARSEGSSDPYNGPLFPGYIVLPPVSAVITLVPGLIATLPGADSSNGFIGGAQIGYNWQVKQFVFGLEADVTGTDLDGSKASASRTQGTPLFAPAVTQTVTVDFGRIDWMASFRGRLGLAADRALFYVTGGAAVANIGGTTTTVVNGPGIAIPAGTFSLSSGGSTTRWGWTVGGGIEWAFNHNWSLAGEYRHSDFGSRGATIVIPDGLGGTLGTGTTNSRLPVDQAPARLNYRFGGPVVAKY